MDEKMPKRHGWRRVSRGLACALFLLASARASAIQGKEAFVFQPLEGAALKAQIEAVDGRRFTLSTSSSIDFNKIWFFHGPASAVASDGRVELRLQGGAERFVGDVIGGDEDGESLSLRSSACGQLRIALDDVALMRVRGRAGFPAAARFAASGDDETVFRETALGFDPVRGVLEAVESKGLRFEIDGGSSELFPWSEIAGMRLPSEAVERDSKLHFVLLLRDGSRVRGLPKEIVTVAGKRVLVFEHAKIGTMKIELRGILGGHVVDPATRVYLAQLEPRAVEERDQFSDRPLYPWKRDANLFGDPLVVQRKYWTSGLGVHARSAIDIEVPKGCRRLQAWIGADDSAAKRRRVGDMHFRILRGKDVLADVESVKGGQRAQPLAPIAVEGGQTIRLLVDFGRALHTLDRGNWLAPVFVR